MRIAIIGPGALGCLFATKLFSAVDEQDSILLVDHRPKRAELLNRQGVIYESGDKQQISPVPVSSKPADIAPLDVIISCVKSHDLPYSLKFIAPLLSRQTLLVFLQNGISHLQYKDPEVLGATPVFATTSEGTTRLSSGHIRHAGSGHTYLGFLESQEKNKETKLQNLIHILQNSGFNSSLSGDIRAKLWAKLFANVGINGLTALLNIPNGELLSSAATRNTLEKLVKEAEQVARAVGIAILEDPVQTTIDICLRTAQNKSSMLQDVQNCRPTEIDAINGAVSKIAQEFGIPTPYNDKLISQIREMEASYLNGDSPKNEN